MDGKNKKQKNHTVKESNALARARIKPASTSVWDMRVIATVAARNTTSDELFREHTLDMRELNRGYELSTLQISEAKKAIRVLGQKTYEILLPECNGIEVLPIFTRLKLDGSKGIIIALFNEALKPHYLNLRKCFTLLRLLDFQKLTSVYAQKLYEILSSWRSEGEVEISLGELQSLLNVPVSFKQYNNFRAFVLEVAHREINAVAKNSASDNPLEFDWEAIRPGKRKVVAIRFIFNARERENQRMIEETRKKLKSIGDCKIAAENEGRKFSGGNSEKRRGGELREMPDLMSGFLGLPRPSEEK